MATKKAEPAKSEPKAEPVASITGSPKHQTPKPKPVKAQASKSKFRAGKGTARETNRVITIYGPFKSRKTTSISNLPMGRTKWICSDSNCIPTLRALGRMPHPDDIYEPGNIAEFREILEEMVALCETEGRDALGVDYLAIDSYTQFSDWHQQDVAKATGQRFLGDDKSNNGWQQFNAEFGGALDLLVALSRYITIVGIVHAKAKFDTKKGEYSSFSLSPAMSERLGRISNWILLKDLSEVIDDAKLEDARANPDDPFYSHEGDKVYEDIFYTKPTAGWVASVNTLALAEQEPGADLTVLLKKDGLL